MAIKLIALDLDGTTLNDDRVISRRNREALSRAAEKGVNIVIATGRPFSALPEDVFELDAVRYVLTSNGASITDLKENSTFYENCLSPLAVERSVELLRAHDYVVECFVKGTAYIDREYFETVKKTGSSIRNIDYILKTRNPVDDIYGFMLSHKNEIENININFEDISEKPVMREKLKTLPETTITSSFKHNLEIGGATTSKAEALSQMGRLLGIEQSEMMAIGDSPNDMAMLLASGMPVAVGNAEEEVKAIARYVAPSNHEDGVADAVEKFVLND
ncbi:MAG: HAD family hydrolase [Bacillota bacterium]|nr:HAD family hydrolase [Bacillota bacterium]